MFNYYIAFILILFVYYIHFFVHTLEEVPL